MKSKEIRQRLREEFERIVPNVLGQGIENSLENQPIVDRKPTKVFFAKKILTVTCALAAAFMLGVGFSNLYFQVSASISLDINPSISIDVNKFDRVIDVKSYNSQAEAVIGSLKLRNATSANAINAILVSAQSMGYIVDNYTDNAILLSIWASDTDDITKFQHAIRSNIENQLRTQNIVSEIRFQDVDTTTYHHAQETNVSSGKIKLADDIIRYDNSFEEKELLSKPVKELFEVYDHCQNMNSQGHRSDNSQPPAEEPVITPVPTVPQQQMTPHHRQNGHMRGRGMHY